MARLYRDNDLKGKKATNSYITVDELKEKRKRDRQNRKKARLNLKRK